MKGFRLFPSFLVAFALTLLSIGQAQAQVTYYINDHLGSPIAAEDENGVLLWRERYSPFGDTQLGQKRDEETPGYTGKRYYADLGLSYFGARWYDSTSGRFITPDPAGWQESSPYFSFNQYAYANNNPYVYTDPDGEFPFLIPVAIFLAKEIAGEIFERTTGVPAVFSVKGAGKAIFKQGRKLVRKSANRTVLQSSTGTRGYRYMTEGEIKAIKETGMLRGGNPGETFFTKDVYKSGAKAQDRLSLPSQPTYRVEFEITNNPSLLRNGSKIKGDYGQKGGGSEFMSKDPIHVDIINSQSLR